MPSKYHRDIEERNLRDHRKRIANMKSSIDNKPARAMPFSQRMEMERKRVQKAIELDNRLLLDRLEVAMSHKNIDNDNNLKTYPSILAAERKQHAIKAGLENKRLLHRIQNTNPVYDHFQWEREAQQRGEYLKNMSVFPDYFVNPYDKKKGGAKKGAGGGSGPGPGPGPGPGATAEQRKASSKNMGGTGEYSDDDGLGSSQDAAFFEQQQQLMYADNINNDELRGGAGSFGHPNGGTFAMKASGGRQQPMPPPQAPPRMPQRPVSNY